MKRRKGTGTDAEAVVVAAVECDADVAAVAGSADSAFANAVATVFAAVATFASAVAFAAWRDERQIPSSAYAEFDCVETIVFAVVAADAVVVVEVAAEWMAP